MALDSAHPEARRHDRDIWRLPKVVDLEVGVRHFEPPRRVTEEGKDRFVDEAVEIAIRVSEPFETRALNPVLWVGEEPLTVAEPEPDAPDVVRFYSFAPEALQTGAPIALAWNATGAERMETGFRFERGEARA
ncbi:MAG TPA: hypothetical protein VGQ42_13030 [Candidatus Dormibacteraeota bacterium]|jgi:hypothetical protein|nr:hypothetical protein [Candidatus Dormibacteraeota bacterium]